MKDVTDGIIVYIAVLMKKDGPSIGDVLHDSMQDGVILDYAINYGGLEYLPEPIPFAGKVPDDDDADISDGVEGFIEALKKAGDPDVG